MVLFLWVWWCVWWIWWLVDIDGKWWWMWWWIDGDFDGKLMIDQRSLMVLWGLMVLRGPWWARWRVAIRALLITWKGRGVNFLLRKKGGMPEDTDAKSCHDLPGCVENIENQGAFTMYWFVCLLKMARLNFRGIVEGVHIDSNWRPASHEPRAPGLNSTATMTTGWESWYFHGICGACPCDEQQWLFAATFPKGPRQCQAFPLVSTCCCQWDQAATCWSWLLFDWHVLYIFSRIFGMVGW